MWTGSATGSCADNRHGVAGPGGPRACRTVHYAAAAGVLLTMACWAALDLPMSGRLAKYQPEPACHWARSFGAVSRGSGGDRRGHWLAGASLPAARCR
jgi:hypothetical protein